VICLTPSLGSLELFAISRISPPETRLHLLQHRLFTLPPTSPRLPSPHRRSSNHCVVGALRSAIRCHDKRLASHRTASVHHPQLACSGRRKVTVYPNSWDRSQTSRTIERRRFRPPVNLQSATQRPPLSLPTSTILRLAVTESRALN
jgi:hypothetical protein